MALSKKITVKKPVKKAEVVEEVVTASPEPVARKQMDEMKPAKKVCFFCKGKTSPSYIDVVTLRKFINDRAKIVAKSRNGLCSKHQRRVSEQIKYARNLALLPFTPVI